MSVIKLFRALRPRPETAKQVSSVPYDVCSRDELQELIENNPISFLRVTRAEVEAPREMNSEDQAVFEIAKNNLRKLIEQNVLTLEDEPLLYVYRLANQNHTQTGVVACCSLNEYEAGTIKKHEKVRPDKVQDRTRHMVTVRAQTGLIFLAFRQTEEIKNLIAEAATAEPLFDFVAIGDIRNTIWRAREPQNFVAAFEKVPALYVADGHHRLEAASLARKILNSVNPYFPDEIADQDEYDYVVAGIFPDTDLQILPYNRAVRDLNGLGEQEFLQRLNQNFTVAETDDPRPNKSGEFCLYLADKWYRIEFKKSLADFSEVEKLDVSILQNYLLRPILGIENVQTDQRIEFVGGIRGTEELEKLVDSGKAQVAFSMFPTTVEDLFNVSDAQEIMPPKSTWFEPKLRDGLLIHLI